MMEQTWTSSKHPSESVSSIAPGVAMALPANLQRAWKAGRANAGAAVT
jgi:hypothetical protein